jgi:uncharacterized lipoprotein YbaY
MHTRAILSWALLVAPALCGQEPTRSLRGTLVYAQKIALPRRAEIRALLVDVAAPASAIAGQTWWNESRQIPIPFVLAVPVQSIRADHRYEIRAEIRIQEKRWFLGAISLTGTELRKSSKPLVVTLNRVP